MVCVRNSGGVQAHQAPLLFPKRKRRTHGACMAAHHLSVVPDAADSQGFDNDPILTVTVGQSQLSLKGEDQLDTRHETVHGEDLYLVIVADGHGGKEAAAFLKVNIINMIVEQLQR